MMKNLHRLNIIIMGLKGLRQIIRPLDLNLHQVIQIPVDKLSTKLYAFMIMLVRVLGVFFLILQERIALRLE